MWKKGQRGSSAEQASRSGIGNALKTAYPVEPASSFNADVAGLLSRLEGITGVDRPWREE